eukprot:TRINITY_DN10804_c1_g1_i1.p1 TRINITY_DN10804_c1_g1~~TRINITY_DN10804_c1_g1_i1.p1  ORF type:complete len:781 (+),score=221.47 TRINITY_DN10804_c1_g1_i1:51-2393(+)
MAEHRVVCVAAQSAKRVKTALQGYDALVKNLVGIGISAEAAAAACAGMVDAAAKVVYFPLSDDAACETVLALDGVLCVSQDRIPVKLKTKQEPPASKAAPAAVAAAAEAMRHQPPGGAFHGCAGIETLDLSLEAWRGGEGAPSGSECEQREWRVWTSRRLAAVARSNVPVLLKGLPIGRCVETWDETRLAAVVRKKVAAQVCPHRKIDLAGHRAKNTRGNFAFHDMSFSELVARCAQGTAHRVPRVAVRTLEDMSSEAATSVHATASTEGDDEKAFPPIAEEGERYYLRSVPEGKMKAGSHFPALFPTIADDFDLEALNSLVAAASPLAYHSSAMRVTSPATQLWTHYDILDNLLVQVVGAKHCSLWPPACEPDLYVEGTSSRVDDIHSPHATKYPRYRHAAQARRMEVMLNAGEVLYIPALWFHHTLSTSDRMSIAVNVFYEAAPLRAVYHAKDVYANKDLPVGVKAVEAALRTADSLAALPQPFQAFYAMRAAEVLLQRCGVQRAAVYEGSKKVAVVTGAGGRIGGAICAALVDQGYFVVAVARRREVPFPGEPGEDGCVRVCDLACGRSVAACIADLRHEFRGGVAHLVNAAAVVPQGKVLTGEGVELQFAVNVLSYHRFIDGLAPLGLQTVTNIASSWASWDGLSLTLPSLNFEGVKYSPAKAYRASKQANRVLTRAWQALFDADGRDVTVVSAHPGAVASSNVSSALGLKPHDATHTPQQAATASLVAVTTPPPARADLKGKFVTASPDGEVHAQTDSALDTHCGPLMRLLRTLA